MDSYSNSSVNFTFTDRTLQSNTRNAYTCRQFWKINIRNNSRFITKEGYTEKQIHVSLFRANYSLKYCFTNSWKSLPFAGSTGFLLSGLSGCFVHPHAGKAPHPCFLSYLTKGEIRNPIFLNIPKIVTNMKKGAWRHQTAPTPFCVCYMLFQTAFRVVYLSLFHYKCAVQQCSRVVHEIPFPCRNIGIFSRLYGSDFIG